MKRLKEFLSKLIEQEIPYLLIDVTYFYARDWLHYENKAIFIVAGIGDDGYGGILGAKLTDSEYSLFSEDLHDQ